MNDKQQLLNELFDISNHWQELLSDLSEDEILQPLLPSDWTVKDIVAHMWSWQQASVARADAALHNTLPDYPSWWEINGPDPEEDVDRTNAYLFEACRDKPWSIVYADWKAQFEHFLELSRQIPEKDLLEPGKYTWMGNFPLAASAIGSLDHHREHFETLRTWLQDDGR